MAGTHAGAFLLIVLAFTEVERTLRSEVATVLQGRLPTFAACEPHGARNGWEADSVRRREGLGRRARRLPGGRDPHGRDHRGRERA
jgi:hypothetical protein